MASERVSRRAFMKGSLVAGEAAALGLMSTQIVLYSLISLPGLLLGVYVGNRTFFRISEKVFGAILGGVLIVLSWGLIL